MNDVFENALYDYQGGDQSEKNGLNEHKHMVNTQIKLFLAIDSHNTEYISEVVYTQFNGMMIKLMAWLFPSTFKAQSEKWMLQFKEFAERSQNE